MITMQCLINKKRKIYRLPFFVAKYEQKLCQGYFFECAMNLKMDKKICTYGCFLNKIKKNKIDKILMSQII